MSVDQSGITDEVVVEHRPAEDLQSFGDTTPEVEPAPEATTPVTQNDGAPAAPVAEETHGDVDNADGHLSTNEVQAIVDDGHNDNADLKGVSPGRATSDAVQQEKIDKGQALTPEDADQVPVNAYEEESLAEDANEVQREVKDHETGWTAQSSHGVLLPHFVPTQDYKEIEANPDERILNTEPEVLGSPAELQASAFEGDSF